MAHQFAIGEVVAWKHGSQNMTGEVIGLSCADEEGDILVLHAGTQTYNVYADQCKETGYVGGDEIVRVIEHGDESRRMEKRAARMEHIAIESSEDWYAAYNAPRNRKRTYNVSVRKHNTRTVTVVCGYSGNVRNATVLCDENSLEYATRAIGEHLAKLYADGDNAPRRVLVTLD